MTVSYEDVQVQLDPATRRVHVSFHLVNNSSSTWRGLDGYFAGWQIFDPETATFIAEGDWMTLSCDLAARQGERIELGISLPPERGHYHVYISPIAPDGWFYHLGSKFLLLDVLVQEGQATLNEISVTTIRALRRKNFRRAFVRLFSLPFQSLFENRGLIRSMVRRDVLARYRGSFGDVLWTILHPALLMATYFFVFGVVLQSRFGEDTSRSGFVVYFLAGMLPWLAFSEAAGRAPQVILEHRNFVKKLIFPVETLPVNHVISGLVTEGFALIVFVIGLLIFRGHVPGTAFWLPVLLVPQLLFTLGTCWLLAAIGVFFRDLTQMMGFVLTLWFFLTPICYPETLLPRSAAAILTKNPIYVLVKGYRAIFLEGQPPPAGATWKLWILSAVIFFLGYACFHKLRKSFADVV